MTYDLLDSVTLASSASSVTFSSISQDYGDLILVVEWTGSGGVSFVGLQFNGDTGSNYSRVLAQGRGASGYSSTASTSAYLYAGTSAGTSEKANAIVQIMDYTATDKHKSVLMRDNNALDRTVMTAARWANTSSLSQIDIITSSNSYAAGSTFYLYGVAA